MIVKKTLYYTIFLFFVVSLPQTNREGFSISISYAGLQPYYTSLWSYAGWKHVLVAMNNHQLPYYTFLV